MYTCAIPAEACAGERQLDPHINECECETPQAGHPTHEVALDPVLNRSGDTWHIALPQLDADLLYGVHC